MTLYAVTPARRVRQVGADAAMLGWVVLWVLLARAVHGSVLGLRGPARELQQAGSRFHDGLSSTSDTLGRLPVVGDQLGPALGRAASSGSSLEQAGRELSQGIGQLALVLGLVTAIVPVLLVGVPWLWVRARFVLCSRRARRELDEGAGVELFALRALTRQPVSRLRRVAPDPALAWRRRDPDALASLAELELAELGLVRPGRRPG